jgi:cytoskeletal protein RodZ
MTENFGAFLKHERELRGVPLEEIAGATKIHMRYLLALENNEFEDLPGEVFIKGYIRAYAKNIGTDEDEILNTYELAVGRDRYERLQQQEAQESGHLSANKQKVIAVGGGTVLFLLIGIATFWMLTDSADQPLERAKIEIVPIAQTNAPFRIQTPEAIQKPEPDMKSSTTTEAPPSAKLSEQIPQPTKLEKKSQVSPPEPESASPKIKETKKIIKPKPPAQSPKKILASTPAKIKKPPVLETFSEFRSQGFHTAEGDNTATSTTSSTPAKPKKPSLLVKKEVIIQTVAVNVSDSGIAENSLAISELELKIEVQDNAWFNMKVDNSREEDFILPQGSAKTFTAKEQFVITIGNTEGTILFLNDQAIALPKGSGRVVRNFLINSKLLLD